MLGLGSNISKLPSSGATIITDNLVLRHQYMLNPVQPLSDGAAYFVGSNTDYITMGDQTNLNMGEGSFSVSCWVKSVQTGTTNFVVSKSDGQHTAAGNDKGFALYLGDSGTDWTFWVSDGTNRGLVQTAVAANANQWYHVCGTFDTSGTDTVTLYVDGVLIGSEVQALGDIDVSDNFLIGGGGTTYDWDGYVCNVGLWDAVLTQAQIKSIMWKDYVGLSASEKTDLVSWWNLDSVIPDTTTLVYDNHHGDGNTFGSELVINGDFTVNEDDWDGYAGVWSNTAGPDGTAGNLLVTSPGGGAWGYIYHAKTILTVGKSYRLSFWFKKGEGTETGTFRAGTSNLGGEYFSSGVGVDPALGTSTSWTYFEKYFTATHATIHLNPASSTGAVPNSAYFDDISIKEVNGNTGTLS